MARVKGALATRKRRNKTLKLAKGYFGAKSKLFKTAKEAVMKSGNYAYIGRRLKKRDFRRLWITRISAGAKANGMNYSTFMNGLNKAGIKVNRKMLAELAVSDPAGFATLVKKSQKALEKASAKAKAE
ncbi:MAG: 50S ribosomal protein L20 [Clostridiales bacterium]|nr:50S ribosomal protein L20 [Candidatus Equinaster intestinalis]